MYVVPMMRGTQVLAALIPLNHIDASGRRLRSPHGSHGRVGGPNDIRPGWLLARRALSPVSVLTVTAAGIAQSRTFSRRVPVPREGGGDELGRLAATFNEMLASLDDAYQAQARFLSAASHELRAPLTVIQANLELLHDRGDRLTPPDRDRAVREAYVETMRLSRLVADLLSLARADAGVPLRRREPVELDRVLLNVIGEARHFARGQRFEITEVAPMTIMGDPDRLKQLVLNLVDNAIKYTQPNGRVSVALRRTGEFAEVVIRDTGIGIAADELPHVFERFYRADTARSRDPGGTGLGLPIARWIVEQHGGTMELGTTPGHGTIALVRLPRRMASAFCVHIRHRH